MTGVAVIGERRGGAPMPREVIAKVLDAAGVFEERDDSAVPGEVVSTPTSWQWGDTACPYFRRMVEGWASDTPHERHPWLLSQFHRLECARRLGCVTEADYRAAEDVLTGRFTYLRSVGNVKPVGQYEIQSAHVWAIDNVARKSDAQARGELGNHRHGSDQVTEVPALETDEHHSVPRTVAEQAAALAEAHRVFQRWLGDEYDLAALNIVLAALAVERLNGDPLWLLIVSGSGNAKTETVVATASIPNVHVVSTISSPGALLSGTSKRERAADASGGLLRVIGDHGALIIKDMTSILSMGREMRAEVLAALREIYDGAWTRTVGTDGGRTLEWSGRISVIGAVTTAWDTHHSVVAAMGDRFVLLRMDSTQGRSAAGRRAIANTGSETAMRAELADAVVVVVAGVPRGGIGAELTEAEAERLLDAADLVTLTRTGVEYDHRGEVIDAHAPEMPTRFAKQLAQVFRGGIAVGMTREAALALAIRAARDSVPPLRLAIIDHLAAHPGDGTSDVRKRLDKPHTTVDRQLRSLHMLGVITCSESDGRDQRRGWSYRLNDGVRPDALALTEMSPEMSVGIGSEEKMPPDLSVGKAQMDEGCASLGAPSNKSGDSSVPTAATPTHRVGRPEAHCTGCGGVLMHPESVAVGRCAACRGGAL
ncbi:MAG: hypothetical protein ACSLE6_06465 [Mycobacterium sp.]